jgi:hypothetical protein
MRSFKRGVNVQFGCRNPKLLRAETLNACHLVTTTVGGGGGGGSTVSQKKKNNYPECPWSLRVYWRRRRMCGSTAAVPAFASHAAATASATFRTASASSQQFLPRLDQGTMCTFGVSSQLQLAT